MCSRIYNYESPTRSAKNTDGMAMLAGDESGDDEHLEDPDNVAQIDNY